MNVDLTLHDFDESLLKEFIKKIVKPYFKGNMNEAVKALMHRALVEEGFLKAHVEPVEVS